MFPVSYIYHSNSCFQGSVNLILCKVFIFVHDYSEVNFVKRGIDD